MQSQSRAVQRILVPVDRLSEGLRVVDVTGIRVGHVVRVEDGRFLVARESDDQAGAWLRVEAIFNVDGGVVTLVCNGSELERYEDGAAKH